MNSSPNSTLSRLQTNLATLRPVVLAAAFTTNLNWKAFLRPEGKETLLQPEKRVGEKEAVTETRPKKNLLDQEDINIFASLIPTLTNYFTSRADCFKAGQLVDYEDNWQLITSDQEILAMVQGQHIEFLSIPF